MRAVVVLLALARVAAAGGFSLTTPPRWVADPQTLARAKAAHARLPERVIADAVAYRSPDDPRFVMIAQVFIYPGDQRSLEERAAQMMDALARSVEAAGLTRRSSTSHPHDGQIVAERWYQGGGLSIRLGVRTARDASGDLHALQIICTDDDKVGDCRDAIASAALDMTSDDDRGGGWLYEAIAPAVAIVVVAAAVRLRRRGRR
jgi:hypothetical protein